MNEVALTYNEFGQIVGDRQSHSGAVDVNATPQVRYEYADGSNNTIRPTALVYPNGRVVGYDYGEPDEMNDALSRIASLVDDDDTQLVEYDYLGLGSFVGVTYPEPNVVYTLASLTNTNDPDTGDIYSGLDQFGRVKDCRWYNATAEEDVVRLQYGYDQASNRLYRADLVAQSLSKEFDELYTYDGLHRLKEMGRGLLVFSSSQLTTTNPQPSFLDPQHFAQCWTLDSTSNWTGFKEAATGGSWTLDQTRTANGVNEITGISNTTGAGWAQPAHDPAGNMTTIPKPADPTDSFHATYDAWNRLVKLTDGGTVQENQYDPRTFRTVRKDYIAGDLAETRHYFYTPSWQIVEERYGDNPNEAMPDRQFTWGQRYIDDLILRDRDTDDDGTLDERLYGLQDANWNVTALIDETAAVEERYAYSPFGTPIIFNDTLTAIRTNSDFDVEVLFTGQRYDSTTRLHLFRRRWFDTATGRFISRDPKGYPDGLNAYAGWFVPARIDPLGTEGKEYPSRLPPGFGARPGEACAACHPVAPRSSRPSSIDFILIDGDYNIPTESYYQYFVSVPYYNTVHRPYGGISALGWSDASSKLDKRLDHCRHCVKHLMIGGHGSAGTMQIQPKFLTPSTRGKGDDGITSVGVGTYILHVQNQPIPGTSFVPKIPGEPIGDFIQMASRVCKGGTITLHMCGIDAMFRSRLLKLLELSGRDDIELVTHSGSCDYRYGYSGQTADYRDQPAGDPDVPRDD